MRYIDCISCVNNRKEVFIVNVLLYGKNKKSTAYGNTDSHEIHDAVTVCDENNIIYNEANGDLMVYMLKPGKTIKYNNTTALSSNLDDCPIAIYENQPGKLFEGLNETSAMRFIDEKGWPAPKYYSVWNKEFANGFKNIETFLAVMEDLDIFYVIGKTHFKYDRDKYFGHQVKYFGKAKEDAQAGRFGKSCSSKGNGESSSTK